MAKGTRIRGAAASTKRAKDGQLLRGCGSGDVPEGLVDSDSNIRKGSGRADKEIAKEIILQRAKAEQQQEAQEKGIGKRKSIVQSLPQRTHSGRMISSKIKPITRSTYPYPITKKYLTMKEIVEFNDEVKLEILCTDGLHYHVNFRRDGASMILHFPQWNQRYDIVANENSIMEYCLSPRGMYSINDRGDPVPGKGTDQKGSKVSTSKTPRKRKQDEEAVSVKRTKTIKKDTRANETASSLNSIVLGGPSFRSGDQDPISPSHLPIGLVGEVVHMVCLASHSSLNPSAEKYTEFMREVSGLELVITSQRRRINEIDSEVALLKSRISHQSENASSLSSWTDWTSSSLKSTPELENRESLASSKEAWNRNQTRLLEEKITRLEKIDILRKEQIALSHYKDATLNFLTENALDILRSKIRENLETFLIERENHRR
jgi:hypothetical protein